MQINTRSTSSKQSSNQTARWLTLIGFAAMVYPTLFVLLFTFAGVLRPGYSPIRQAVSDLGVGPMAWLVDLGLIVLGLVMVALAVGFFQVMRPIISPAWRWTSAILIALPGLGYAVGGIFTEAPSTLLVHYLVGAALGLYFPAITFLTVGLGLVRHHEWRRYGIYSLVIGIVTVAAVVFIQLAFMPDAALAGFHVGGLAERVDLIVILAWYIVFGWRIFHTQSTKG